tara:strand:- start:176654 stop:177586 length:933 start_codon:yes stop_codon:yes gene_type:complete
MNEKTKQDYLKLAQYFLQHRLIDNQIPLTPKNIRQALTACAKEYRPAYWRRLRCALITQQRETGFSKQAELIKAVRNPITLADASSESKALRKTKQRRCKSVNKEQHFMLKNHLINKQDFATVAAIENVRIVGCRPSEISGIKLMGDNQVFIPGAKKTENGLRGLDRIVIVSNQDYATLSYSRGGLFDEVHHNKHNARADKAMQRIQHRLAHTCKTLWPKQKHRISLYSYRHQMGSDLKTSGMSRQEVAAIMGHQSVDSVDVYGNKHNSSRTLSIKASTDSITHVRKTQQKNTDFIASKKKVMDMNKDRN